ncbi:MAG: acetate--CoA ligase family protein [Candidatus Delongbacteria bacterium]|nr:acetate--CoA ligase family protein [Candidatus Delongbacteria bacterium]MBN2835362.1 acetate--CoA ligase family protein [Candidatus Delongbacteria bacterium]
MIAKELINPSSIVVVGGSNDTTKPGGKVLLNLKNSGFKGEIYIINPKEDEVQGLKCYKSVEELPNVDTAIISIPAKLIPGTVDVLANKKNCKGYIVLAGGFSETSHEGKILEDKMVEIINSVDGSLIGPNCIGLLTPYYNGTFTEPAPELDKFGCDFASGSGATAVFILESAIPNGLKFASIYSVGNSPQIGVEEVVKYWDETFDPETSSKVKLLYVENIDKPEMLLKHAKSLVEKGCKIAAVKSGSSEAGSRAASSHTGALASPDKAVDALFRKAGIIRCYGRQDLASVASVFMHKELTGKNIAVITHAGGPAVMLTDSLSNGGLAVPHIDGEAADELLTKLFPGSAVGNPIDFLATGTAEQLGIIIDYVDQKFDNIDGMVVIFGTPGLFEVYDAYKVLDEKMKVCKKPIYPVLPSLITAGKEVEFFLNKGRINFPDEVVLGNALCRVFNGPKVVKNPEYAEVDTLKIRNIIERSNITDGYLPPHEITALLDAAGIPRAGEKVVVTKEECSSIVKEFGFPLVMKVVGPVHKSDVGGVVLNVKTEDQAISEFERLMTIKDATGVLIQPMLSGTELFAGAKFEDKFGHMVLCGMGGIFIEVLKDTSTSLVPVSKCEATKMIKDLKSYKIIEGVRGQKGIDQKKFVNVIMRLSALLQTAPEIIEMDLNPLLGTSEHVTAVDARIRIQK